MTQRLLALAATALAGFAAGALTAGSATSGRKMAPANLSSPDAMSATGARVNDPIAAAFGAFRGGYDLRSLADLGGSLGTLDSSQIAALFDRIEQQPGSINDDRLPWLFGWWMKRDPKAAAAWLRPRMDRFALLGAVGLEFTVTSNGKLLDVWLKADPAAALEYALAHSRSGLAVAILHSLDPKALGKSDGEWFGILRTLPDSSQRREALEAMLAKWAGRDSASALAAAQALPEGFAREEALGAVLKKWSETDPAGAVGEYRKLGIADPPVLSSMLANAMEKDRASAFGLLGKLDERDFARCAPSLVDAWAKSDPVAALSWALEHGVSITTQGTLRTDVVPSWLGHEKRTEYESVTPLKSAFEADAAATLAWIRALPPGPDRERMLLLAIPKSNTPLEDAVALFAEVSRENAPQAAYELASRFRQEPERGRAWAESLPAGAARTAAWRGLGNTNLASNDLPAGPDLDAFLFGRAFNRGWREDPASAFTTALQISDPVLRRDAFEFGMQEYLKGDRANWAAEARAWLEKADIPEEWKRRWR